MDEKIDNNGQAEPAECMISAGFYPLRFVESD
jgi:hypothetical protein